ncbi:MAG: hypothetical protein KF841_04765 [Phycisphaerae bacterium]|nr:hypothetical protein [Phycisphaerae bacterium]
MLRFIIASESRDDRRNRSLLCSGGVAAALALFCAVGVVAEQNTGSGPRPPLGGGGVVIDPLPPGIPCNPPQLPPGPMLPSYARGQIRETCGGILRPVADKAVKVKLLVTTQVFSCDPNYNPPASFFESEIATGQTDSNGEFDIEFYTGVAPNSPLTTTQVRIVVIDDNGTVPIWQTAFYGQNQNQEYFVYEDVNYCVTEGTRIRILSPNGGGVLNAELYVNGVLYPERSNANGFITVNPPLAAGSKLVARALVHESASERDGHSRGGTQNWKYRAYITSLPLIHDANGDNPRFTPTLVTDPNGAYSLQLQRDAAHIGLHLVASVEWDASPSELSGLANDLRDASEYLYNATDGQMLIERVDIFDDMARWDEADFRIYANASLRAHVDWPADGFWRSDDLCCWRSSHIHMSRSNDSPVYVHEFGHYGLLLKDEYEDDNDTHCAHGVGGADPKFASNGGKASCMMFNQWSYTKICSIHPDNPHLTGTRQGNQDCWSEIKEHFTAEAPGPNGAPRWRIRTPVDRGVIVGRLAGIPVDDWRAFVGIDDANNVQLCQPVQFKWSSHNGMALGARVFSKDTRGRMIVQGFTDATGVIKPFQNNVRTVAGVHIGDTVGAQWTAYVGNSYQVLTKKRKFTQDDCTSALVVLKPAPGQVLPSQQVHQLVAEAAPFDLAVQLEPIGVDEILVRVRPGAELASAPIVRLSVETQLAPRDVPMSLEPATGDWIGRMSGFPEQFTVIAEVSAVNATGESAEVVTQSTIAGAAHDDASELASADGLVEIEVQAGAFMEPTRIAIGGSTAPLPHDFPGRMVAGPIALSTDGAVLSAPVVLRFLLPFDSQESMLNEIDPQLLIVLAFDEQTGFWNEIDSRFLNGKLAVETQIAKLGAFALIERGAVGPAEVPVEQDESGVDSGEVDTAGGQTVDNADTETGGDQSSDSAGTPVDFGSGACGGGAAMASSLMLAMIGTGRRMRSNRRQRRVRR